MIKPTFKKAQLFFQSYGLLPLRQVLFTNGAIASPSFNQHPRINDACYGRMKVEACSLFGSSFLEFVKKEMGRIDGEWQMVASDWNELREDFDSFDK